MPEKRCHICLKPIETAESGIYHDDCCKALFNAFEPPDLPYTWNDLNALAKKVVRRHVTVPGVQPKLSLHLEGGHAGTERLTLVGMEGGYILKLPVEQYPEMPELEHLSMRLARLFGIETCECGLISLSDGQTAFIARRMDRIEGQKRHMEDMCQLTDRLTERKYSGSLEQVGKAILQYCDNALFDALRFFELLIFCFLTGNADMHLKNFSLIYDPGGEVRLSPAYDLLPTALLLPQDQEESALTINGKKRKLDGDDFRSLARSLTLNDKQIDNAFARFSERLEAAYGLLEDGLCSQAAKKRFVRLIETRGTLLA